jgi:hypothetical protein
MVLILFKLLYFVFSIPNYVWFDKIYNRFCLILNEELNPDIKFIITWGLYWPVPGTRLDKYFTSSRRSNLIGNYLGLILNIFFLYGSLVISYFPMPGALCLAWYF